MSPMEFVFDAEARERKNKPGPKQTPKQQQAIFEAWAAAKNAPHAAPLKPKPKQRKPHGN